MISEKSHELSLLLVDDETPFLLSESLTLAAAGFSGIVQCQDAREVMPLLSRQDFRLIVMDMSMPYVSGWDLLPQIVANHPHIPVVILSAIDEVGMAVQSMKAGAFDYLVKPVDDTRLVTTVRRAIEFREVRHENVLLRQSLLSGKLANPEAFAAIVTQNSKMRSMFQYLEAIAGTSLPVLITGETGVGKELIAGAIHTLSGRKGELVPVNVAGVDDTLFSDTLFGHKRGGFTGADRDRKGLVELAAGGTLFLDEIGDLSLESQVKLLRLLQEGKYYPIGSDLAKLADSRFIVATNQDLDLNQRKGLFRKDLYYRLRAHHVHVPPLRERKDDIPLLVDHFLERAALVLGRNKPRAPRELFLLLRNHPFAGNVRELEGIIFDLVSQDKSGVLSIESIRHQTEFACFVDVSSDREGLPSTPATDRPILFGAELPTLKEIEQQAIEEALRRSNQIQSIAARMLGMSRRALNNRLRRQRQ